MTDALQQQYMTTSEAAEYLGYTIQHTRFLIRDGSLPSRKFGRDWLVDRQTVLNYFDDDTASGQQDALATDQAVSSPPITQLQAVNVAQVPQRSPFRYPGGKTPGSSRASANGCRHVKRR